MFHLNVWEPIQPVVKSRRVLEGDLGETIQTWVIDVRNFLNAVLVFEDLACISSGSAADFLKPWEWSQVAKGAHNSYTIAFPWENVIPALTFQIRGKQSCPSRLQ